MLSGSTSAKAECKTSQVSISSTFYKQHFRIKVFFIVFFCLQFGFTDFCQNNIGAKAAYKMLVKLTKAV